MNVKEFARQMKSAVQEVMVSGTKEIKCENLITYLENVENSDGIEPSTLEVEKYKAELQNAIEGSRIQHETALEEFRAVTTSGQSAIKSSFLLNGGGAVALLAFIGHLAQFAPARVPDFANCLLPFTIGVLAISVTSGMTYLSQWLYGQEQQALRKLGHVANILCIGLGLASYGLFSWGLLQTYSTFVAFQ